MSESQSGATEVPAGWLGMVAAGCWHFETSAMSCDMLPRAVAAALTRAQLELRSYEDIQPREVAEFANLLQMHYHAFSNREKHQRMARDLAAATESGICDLLKFIHKAACDHGWSHRTDWMEDPQRCCFRAVTSASFGPLTPRSVPLPALSPADVREDPLPDTLPLPRLPETPAIQSQFFSPTRAMKAFCRLLMTSCKSDDATGCDVRADRQPQAGDARAEGHIDPEVHQSLLKPGMFLPDPPVFTDHGSAGSPTSYRLHISSEGVNRRGHVVNAQ